MARVLGVHGIAQQYVSGPELTRVWTDGLRGGLEAAGHRATANGVSDSDVRVAFYGDLFRPSHAMGGTPPFTSSDIKSGPEQDLLAVWYTGALEQEPALGPPPNAMGAGKVAVQIMLDRLLRSRCFADVAKRALIGNLKQVNAFLGDRAVKEQVLERVADEVRPETEVVIGHSLGSIVTYEFLARYKPPQVKLLITLGSPLGIPNLVFERLTPAPAHGAGAWPGDVHEWVNVADGDDIVAMRKRLAPLFRAEGGSLPLQDALVDNGDQPHSIARYLNSRPTGTALSGVL